MDTHCQVLPYTATGSFSKMVLDYVEQNPQLRAFYAHPPSVEGVKMAMAARQSFHTNRAVLVQALQAQYAAYTLHPMQQAHLTALLQPHCFTITTAHQPNIFTGPLYVIYKILHVIKLADQLAKEMPNHHFVPVFYMGSEDADLDELGHIYLGEEKLEWQTTQTGAVGRMHPKGLEKIIDRLQNEFGHLPFGPQMVQLITDAYTKHSTIQAATLHLINALFASYGLLVVVPDNALLKAQFSAVVEKELLEQFSQPAVATTSAAIAQHYKVQAAGRPINLFYLAPAGQRERIEKVGEDFSVPALGLQFSVAEMLAHLQQFPERFSANVILRGVFQETILPNVAFVGGGGELAYWLQLKPVFEAAGVPYPVLLLRNSFLLLNSRSRQMQQKLTMSTEQLFWPMAKQELWWVQQHTDGRLLDTAAARAQLEALYLQIEQVATAANVTLQAHVKALEARAKNGLLQLDKKILRAEKRRQQDGLRQLQGLRRQLFPTQNLQERVENFLPLYAQYGPQLLQQLYTQSLCFEQQFVVMHLPYAVDSAQQ
ncbi:MAG: bacillithiol biosynthesis cysteine-adding enzyme BshC [Bacteroidetes bacterium]|nr:MAG: bacillithiol biosynthesis cysteine-adding enzyme BshC [Bacteroidota bacterium]